MSVASIKNLETFSGKGYYRYRFVTIAASATDARVQAIKYQSDGTTETQLWATTYTTGQSADFFNDDYIEFYYPVPGWPSGSTMFGPWTPKTKKVSRFLSPDCQEVAAGLVFTWGYGESVDVSFYFDIDA